MLQTGEQQLNIYMQWWNQKNFSVVAQYDTQKRSVEGGTI